MRLALARTASVVNGFNLFGGEGGVEKFGFIDQPVKEFFGVGILVVTEKGVSCATGKNRSRFLYTVIERAIDINLCHSSIVGPGDVIPGVGGQGVGPGDLLFAAAAGGGDGKARAGGVR